MLHVLKFTKAKRDTRIVLSCLVLSCLVCSVIRDPDPLLYVAKKSPAATQPNPRKITKQDTVVKKQEERREEKRKGERKDGKFRVF